MLRNAAFTASQSRGKPISGRGLFFPLAVIFFSDVAEFTLLQQQWRGDGVNRGRMGRVATTKKRRWPRWIKFSGCVHSAPVIRVVTIFIPMNVSWLSGIGWRNEYSELNNNLYYLRWLTQAFELLRRITFTFAFHKRFFSSRNIH